MYQSGRAGDEAKKRKYPAKSGRVGITVIVLLDCDKRVDQTHVSGKQSVLQRLWLLCMSSFT